MLCPSFEDSDFQTQNEDSNDLLTFAGVTRGLITTSSDYSQDALQLQFHARQDMGGHTMGDRNGFVLSGLGRVFVRLPLGYIYETQCSQWASSILVDGQGVVPTGLDGTKCRQPSKFAYLQDEEFATFMTGVATYAYNTEWYWSRKLASWNGFYKKRLHPSHCNAERLPKIGGKGCLRLWRHLVLRL